MSKRIWRVVPALALLGALGACDSGLTDVNRNPNEPEDVPPANLLGNAIMDAVGGAYGSHGVWFGMYLSNLWSQHLAQPTYGDEDDYVPRPAQENGVFESAYIGPLADLAVVRRIAEARGDENLDAAANTLMQWQFQILTDVYGSIPYSQALQGTENPSPAYDTQQQVYDGILTNLAAAAAQFDVSASVTWGDGDFFYGGDVERWERFANSLRMRAAMRLSEVDAARAQSEFVAAYNAGGFASNADNAVMQWGTSGPSRNPIHVHFTGRPLADFAVSQAIVDTLQNHDDPRLPYYADPALNSGLFRGLPNGTEPEEISLTPADFSAISEWYRRPDAPSFVMTYAEVLFLQAEAAQRGWIAGDPQALWTAGIRANMQQFGISDADINTYIAARPFNGLPSIYTEAWVALFLNGNEAWSLVRRTELPDLTPAVGDQIPNRLSLSPNEALYNPDNYVPTTLFQPLWWDVN